MPARKKEVLMEVRNDTLIFVFVFLAAFGLWLAFSSSSALLLNSKLKAAVTTVCFFPLVYFLYTKAHQPPNVHMSKTPAPWIPTAQALDMCQSSWGKQAVAQTSPTSCCMIFEYVMKLHGSTEWGTFLDAGTGAHSLSWVVGLNTTKWTAITGSTQRSNSMIEQFGSKMREQDEVIFGNWVDPNMLKGQVFDVVLADYLLGSIDGFAPYFQDKLFERLRPHVKKDLYFIGMEPLPDTADTAQGKLVIEIAKLRDACILLAGHRCYREYPQEWTLRHLARSGYKIQNVSNFETIQTRDFVETQLNVAESKLDFIKDLATAEAMRSHIKRTRNRVYDLKWGIRFGGDYVIHATKIDDFEEQK